MTVVLSSEPFIGFSKIDGQREREGFKNRIILMVLIVKIKML